MSEASDRTSRDVGESLIDRVSLALARIPFQLKVAVVWAFVFALLGVFLWLCNFDIDWMQDKLGFIAKGLRFTVILAVGGIVLAVIFAVIGALGRTSRNPIAYGVTGFYVSFFRGTPLLVQLTLIYLALPQVGANLVDRFPELGTNFSQALILEPLTVGIIVLGLNYGAYMTEIFRAGLQSVAGGQGEAADALGMTYAQKMRKVVMPQAFRVIIPPTGNEFIAMMKDTSLIAFLGVSVDQAEVFRRATLVGRADFKPLEALIIAAAMYWVLTAIFTFFQRKLEARISKGYVRGTGKTEWRRKTTQPGVIVDDLDVGDPQPGGGKSP